jgi:hypothetical protein
MTPSQYPYGNEPFSAFTYIWIACPICLRFDRHAAVGALPRAGERRQQDADQDRDDADHDQQLDQRKRCGCALTQAAQA